MCDEFHSSRLGSSVTGRDTTARTVRRPSRHPAGPLLPPDLTPARACLCSQPLRDVPTDYLRRALRPHVHCWQCRTNRICDVPSCMCCRLRSMRGCGRSLLRAVLRYLSARLRRRVVGSNTISKPIHAMPSRQAASTFNSSWKACMVCLRNTEGKCRLRNRLTNDSAASLADR